MKTLIPFIVTVAIGCASHAQTRFALPVPPPPLEEDVLIVAQAPAPAAAPKPPAAPKAISVRAEPVWGLQNSFLKGGSRSSRTLVIPQGDFSTEKLADAEEDLNVMALLLEKAVEQRSDDEKKVLGIDVWSSSSSGVKNLLIEGHGAVFMLKTKIALLPPPAPKKEDEAKAKEQTNSEWEEAREQLYGPSDIDKHVRKVVKEATMHLGRPEEYDKDKVERLKNSLIEGLKSASNIRHLKGDQTVTVVVTSSSSSMYVREVRDLILDETGRGGARAGSGSGGHGSARVYVGESGPRDHVEARSGSRMMLQGKKSDIDSYAKDKLTTDAFREKVKIQIY